MSSFQKTKVDSDLGRKVEEYLVSKGVQTPTISSRLDDEPNKKISIIEDHIKEIWETLGLDLSDDSLAETPKRIAKMLTLELNWGLLPENFPKCTTIENKMGYDEMVLEKNISVLSTCEHHGVVIDGKASVAYIPKDKVIGLSKINRIVEFFSKRPQVQERLTEQIYHTLVYILGTEDVAVVINAVHFCVRSRGVRDYNSSTITSKLGGKFKDGALRSEFLSLGKS